MRLPPRLPVAAAGMFLGACAAVVLPGPDSPEDPAPARDGGAARRDLAAAAIRDLAAVNPPADLPASPDGPPPPQPGDLAENVLATWDVGESLTDEVEPCNPVRRGRVDLVADAGKVKSGTQAVRVLYGPDGSKYFQAIHPRTRNADWNVAGGGLALWIDAQLPKGYLGWAPPGPTVVLCSTNGGYRRLDPMANQLPQSGAGYIELKIPLAGGNGWRATDKNFDDQHVRFLEIHVDPERSGGTGNCTLWLDGVRFY